MLDFGFIRDNWFFIASGIGETLGIAIFSFLLATPIALMVAKGRRSSFLPFKALSTFYVLLIGGIPLLLQIFFIFLALPQLGIILSGFWAGVLALAINYGAYMSEIFYTRFANIGKSQSETRLSLANEFTSMIKDSTLVSMTGFLHDVMWRAKKVGVAEFKNLEAFIIAAIIYLILITIISYSVKLSVKSISTRNQVNSG